MHYGTPNNRQYSNCTITHNNAVNSFIYFIIHNFWTHDSNFPNETINMVQLIEMVNSIAKIMHRNTRKVTSMTFKSLFYTIDYKKSVKSNKTTYS